MAASVFFWSAAIYRRFCFLLSVFLSRTSASASLCLWLCEARKRKTKAVMNHRTPK
jgi:hypothetical protein